MKKFLLAVLFLISPVVASAQLIDATIGSLSGSGGGGTFNTATITGNATLGPTNSVVLASATAAGFTITLPPTASSNGQILTISKVDQTTGAITINAVGTDVIGGTGTVVLNAYMQTDAIVSDGAGHWIPWGQGLQLTPPYLSAQVGSAQTTGIVVSASSDTDVCPFYTPVPVAVTGFRYAVGTTGGANAIANFGIYDSLGKLLTSVSTGTAAVGLQTAGLTTAYNLAPGYYYTGIQISNVNTAISGSNALTQFLLCSRRTGTTMALPDPYTFGVTLSKGFNVYVMVSGGKTSE